LDEAQRLSDEAIKIANITEDNSISWSYVIATSLDESKKTDEAIKIANRIEDVQIRSQALSSIAQSLAQSNMLD
jgi:hypothetical protein